MKLMKKPVLVLLALFVLIPFAQAMAQTPPAAPAPATDAATAQFLATLAGGQAQAPSDLTPAPTFMTNCGNGPACGTGQLCCMLCGNPPADEDISVCYGCVTTTRCPKVV
jgi:hypothetical protein